MEVIAKKPFFYWRRAKHRRHHFDWIANQLGIEKMEDWYNVTKRMVLKYPRSSSILLYYKNSLVKTLQSVYPEFHWNPMCWKNIRRKHFSKVENQKLQFDKLAKELNITEPKQWLNIPKDTLLEHPETQYVLEQYNYSLTNALRSIYPEHAHHFATTTSSSSSTSSSSAAFSTLESHRKYFDWIQQQLHLEGPEAFYKVSKQQVSKFPHTAKILQHYNNSLTKALEHIYPEVKWDHSMRKSVPQGYWLDPQKQREYFDWVGEQLGVKTTEDWYKVKQKDVLRLPHGSTLLKMHKDSLIRALQSVYPEKKFKIFEFQTLPHNYWKSVDNQREYFDWIAKELKISKPEDWNRVTQTMLLKFPRASSVLRQYNFSMWDALKSIYPEVSWNIQARDKLNQQYWKVKSNQRKQFDKFAEQLGITTTDDWYNVTQTELLRLHRSSSVLQQHNCCLPKALQEIYPEFSWSFWNFPFVPKRYFWDQNAVRMYLEEMGYEHGVTHPFEWLSLPSGKHRQLPSISGILKIYNSSFFNMLQSVYPKLDWSSAIRMTSGEQTLHRLLKQLLKGKNIIRCQKMDFGELDFYIPEHLLAFEYQGLQHYKTIMGYDNSADVEHQQQRDEMKRIKCKERGITLIEVGYWWNGSLGSLVATIQRVRPDVPLNFPSNYLNKYYDIRENVSTLPGHIHTRPTAVVLRTL